MPHSGPLLDRRNLLTGAAAAALALSARGAIAQTSGLPVLSGAAKPTDAGYWEAVRGLYTVTKDVINLENGYWGIMADPVKRQFLAFNEMINIENSYYARTKFGGDLEKVRLAVVEALGADAAEVALTRGATEALQCLIGGYNKLKPGDTVLYADLDYDSMQYAMNWLKDRRGVDVVRFAIPEPATRQAVLDAYAKLLADNPRARLLLLTHVSHRTGLVMPVKEIAELARIRGVDVILDAAHSWGQIDFKAADLGVDFIGFNLHKWIGAPLGAGALYIRKVRATDIDRHMGDEDWPAEDVRARIHTGTYNFATMLTVPAALALHREIGSPAKEARLRHLRNHWVGRARAIPGIEILTPDEPGMYGAITSFRFAGKGSAADNTAIVNALRDQHKILTVRRAGIAKGQCIRVTPALYTSEADLERFVEALQRVAA